MKLFLNFLNFIFMRLYGFYLNCGALVFGGFENSVVLIAISIWCYIDIILILLSNNMIISPISNNIKFCLFVTIVIILYAIFKNHNDNDIRRIYSQMKKEKYHSLKGLLVVLLLFMPIIILLSICLYSKQPL